MLLAVALGDARLLLLQLVDLRAQRSGRWRCSALTRSSRRPGRRAWICLQRLSFWMRSVRALVSASLSCVRPRDDDVLAAVERAGVLLLLVLRERQLALPARACPGVRLRRSATRRSSRASATFSARFSRDVFVGEGVDGARRKIRIGRVERSCPPAGCRGPDRRSRRAEQRVGVAAASTRWSRRSADRRRLRRGDQAIRPRRVVLDRGDAVRQRRRLRTLAVEFGDRASDRASPATRCARSRPRMMRSCVCM